MFIAFNKPEPGGTDKAIYNFLLNIFKSCEDNSEVVGTIYKWKDAPFTKELQNIVSNKNLAATLFSGWVLDGESASDYDGIIKNFLDSHGGLFFNDSDGKMNHNKLVLFKQIDIELLKQSSIYVHDACYNDRVSTIASCIYISSANVGENNKHNTSILVPITDEVYNNVKEYILKIQRGYRGENVSHGYITYEWYDKFKLYLFPRSDGKDTLLGVLKNVKHYNNKSNDYCKVCIVSPRWRKARLKLAEAARKLHKNRARVDVLTRTVGQEEMSPEIYEQLRYNWFSLFSFGKGKVSSLRHELFNKAVNIHTKMLLIDGPYKKGDGFSNQKNVWVGSPNLTGPAVKSQWETIIKISDHAAFKDFETNFNFLQQQRSASDPLYAIAEILGIQP